MLLGIEKSVLTVVTATVAVVLLADVIIIMTLHNIKELRKINQNQYIYRIARLDLKKIVCTLMLLYVESYRISHATLSSSVPVLRWLHLIVNVIHSLLAAEYFLMIFMAIDWYLGTAALSTLLATFRKYSKYATVLANVYVMLNMVCSFCTCLIFDDFTGFVSYFLFRFILVVSFIFYLWLIVNYLYYYQNQQEANSVILNTSLVKVSVWLFLTMFIYFFGLERYEYFITGLIFLLLASAFPAIQLIILFACSQNHTASLLYRKNWHQNNNEQNIELQRYEKNFVEEKATTSCNEITNNNSAAEDNKLNTSHTSNEERIISAKPRPASVRKSKRRSSMAEAAMLIHEKVDKDKLTIPAYKIKGESSDVQYKKYPPI